MASVPQAYVQFEQVETPGVVVTKGDFAIVGPVEIVSFCIKAGLP